MKVEQLRSYIRYYRIYDTIILCESMINNLKLSNYHIIVRVNDQQLSNSTNKKQICRSYCISAITAYTNCLCDLPSFPTSIFVFVFHQPLTHSWNCEVWDLNTFVSFRFGEDNPRTKDRSKYSVTVGF